VGIATTSQLNSFVRKTLSILVPTLAAVASANLNKRGASEGCTGKPRGALLARMLIKATAATTDTIGKALWANINPSESDLPELRKAQRKPAGIRKSSQKNAKIRAGPKSA
jgi:hypothetical protein